MIIKLIQYITEDGKFFSIREKAVEHTLDLFYEALHKVVYDPNSLRVSDCRFREMLLKMIPDMETANAIVHQLNKFTASIDEEEE